jgi:hypothetical protein
MITNLSVVCGKLVAAFLIALVAFGREVYIRASVKRPEMQIPN